MVVNQETEILNSKLPLMEDFYTIQGEGFYQGNAAYFIRLGGCDVGCVWCDVKESWDAEAHPKVSVSEMVSRAKASGTEIVVITLLLFAVSTNTASPPSTYLTHESC